MFIHQMTTDRKLMKRTNQHVNCSRVLTSLLAHTSSHVARINKHQEHGFGERIELFQRHPQVHAVKHPTTSATVTRLALDFNINSVSAQQCSTATHPLSSKLVLLPLFVTIASEWQGFEIMSPLPLSPICIVAATNLGQSCRGFCRLALDTACRLVHEY